MPEHRRRSRRLQHKEPCDTVMGKTPPPTKRAKTTKQKGTATKVAATSKRKAPNKNSSMKSKKKQTLPRTLEQAIRNQVGQGDTIVIGVDEAGRGPLAGPVVAAAVHMDRCSIDGIVDSKRIVKETDREALYEQIVTTEARWAIAIVDAPTIDRVNILQATLLGMRWAVRTVLGRTSRIPTSSDDTACVPIHPSASIEHDGCYLVTNLQVISMEETSSNTATEGNQSHPFHALIDGPHVPPDMPCPADPVVRGDNREYCIAAAAVLAKVTRDRLMRSYATERYPQYGLERHKGYPTKAHIEALRTHGPTPIHRNSFAPIKDFAKTKGNEGEVDDTSSNSSK